MCFSATASFITAGLTGAIGIICLSQVDRPRDRLLAMTPLIFAIQQTIEGFLWTNLPRAPDSLMSGVLTVFFLFFADIFWPIYAPIAVLLTEPSEARRRLIRLCFVVGVGVAAANLWDIFSQPYSAAILDDHMVYVIGHSQSAAVRIGFALAYMVSTSLPLVLSSQRAVLRLGVVVLAGSIVAYAFYWEAFVSVWCFFAASASAIILLNFQQSHRRYVGEARA